MPPVFGNFTPNAPLCLKNRLDGFDRRCYAYAAWAEFDPAGPPDSLSRALTLQVSTSAMGTNTNRERGIGA